MKRLLPRVALAIAAAALSLGLGEIVVRLLGAAPGYAAIPFGQYATCADPELRCEPRPGAQGVNAAGLRGDEVAAAKTRPRWLVLGDSIVWGIDLADEQTMPVRLAAHLSAAGELLARSHLLRLLHGARAPRSRPRQSAESDESELALDVVRAGLERIAAVAAGHDPQSLSLPGDLLHPNAQGADLIAEAIVAR